MSKTGHEWSANALIAKEEMSAAFDTIREIERKYFDRNWASSAAAELSRKEQTGKIIRDVAIIAYLQAGYDWIHRSASPIIDAMTTGQKSRTKLSEDRLNYAVQDGQEAALHGAATMASMNNENVSTAIWKLQTQVHSMVVHAQKALAAPPR